MFGVYRPTAEERAYINLGYMTARGCIRFMLDEHSLRIGVVT